MIGCIANGIGLLTGGAGAGAGAGGARAGGAGAGAGAGGAGGCIGKGPIAGKSGTSASHSIGSGDGAQEDTGEA